MKMLSGLLPAAHRGLSFGTCDGNSPLTGKQMEKRLRPLSK